MKNKFVTILLFCSLFLLYSCASTDKAKKKPEFNNESNKVESYGVLYFGKYSFENLSNFSVSSIHEEELYLHEEVTGLEITVIDGIDHYEGKPLKGMSMTDMKKLMGPDKFAAYWAFCLKIGELNAGKMDENTRIEYYFQNGDYFITDTESNIIEMEMTTEHGAADEIVEVYFLLPLSFKLSE